MGLHRMGETISHPTVTVEWRHLKKTCAQTKKLECIVLTLEFKALVPSEAGTTVSDRQADIQTDYYNPQGACALRVNVDYSMCLTSKETVFTPTDSSREFICSMTSCSHSTIRQLGKSDGLLHCPLASITQCERICSKL